MEFNVRLNAENVGTFAVHMAQVTSKLPSMAPWHEFQQKLKLVKQPSKGFSWQPCCGAEKCSVFTI